MQWIISQIIKKMINKEKVIEILKTIYDPEIPINIWDLGIVYDIEITENNDIIITMTLTAPNCPIADIILDDIKFSLKNLDEVNEVKINLTFDPPWSPNMMSEEAKFN